MSQPQILLCVPTGAGDEDAVERLVATLVPPLVATGLATFDTVQKGTWGKDFATVLPTSPFSEAILATARSIGHIPVLQIALDVSDEAVAEAEISRIAAATGLAETFHIGRWNKLTEDDFPDGDEAPACQPTLLEPAIGSIEIYYDIGDVPEGYAHPLDFRNAAMAHIETALAKENAGEWEGAEIGANLETGIPEVNFGFSVTDFDVAERIVRDAVRGTPFDGIREITRFEFAAHG